MVAFDTQIMDLTPLCADPVDLLFGFQMGGGTDIAKAMNYCQSLITTPHRTIVILVSDLCEGGPVANLYKVCGDILESGAKLTALTALDRNANPMYNRTVASVLAGMGAFVGALTRSSWEITSARSCSRRDLLCLLNCTPPSGRRMRTI